MNYSLFENIFLQVLNAHAPMKKKNQRFNSSAFMTKQLRKAIMHRSRLKNVFNKSRTPKTWDSYKKQRNFCVNLSRKTKKEYFENISVKDINDNKKFWKTIKPFFSNKGLNTIKLMIIEKNNLISEESILANMMNQYFSSITKQLNLKKSPQLKNLEDIINYYHSHISIEKIRSSNNTQSELFTFNLVLSDEIKREILNLNNKKASREGDIPVNILKDAIDTYLPILNKVINSSIEQNEFPNELKLADVIPIYKKGPLNKENCRPVSLLSHMSKVFERLLHKQIETFMSNKLSNKLSGFRKNYNTQYCLSYMLEKWKNTLDKGKHVDAVFMDLSKAFDTINHDLLIAKLED